MGFISGACLIGVPFQTAEAHSYRGPYYRAPGYRSRVVFLLPHGSIRLRFSDGTYYYCRGRYYRRHRPFSYVVIPAPVGVVVPSLPVESRTIVIDNSTYHEYDGVYYKGGPSGYTVVPIAQAPAGPGGAAIPVSQGEAAVTPGATVVNVPNKNGSYTPVPLQLASGSMYIGPQGEVYPNLPTVQQLQGLYGK